MLTACYPQDVQCRTGNVEMGQTDDESDIWLRNLAAGDESAVGEFLAAYGPALERIAADRMSPALQRRVGADDVFQSVCRTFFRRARSGSFTLPDRESLWRLLCAITLNKVRKQARRYGARKRGALGDCTVDDTTDSPVIGDSTGVSHEEAVEFADHLAHLIRSLGETEGKLLELKMQGHSHEEIAAKLNCSERTVGRILIRVQNDLQKML